MHPSLANMRRNVHRNRTFVSIFMDHFSTIMATYFISLVGFVLSYSMKHKYCIFFGLKSYNKGIIYFNKFQTNVSNSHEIEGVCILITNQIYDAIIFRLGFKKVHVTSHISLFHGGLRKEEKINCFVQHN